VGRIAFEVEQAGCASCAQRVRAALGALGAVREVEIDEAADTAAVVMEARPGLSQEAVNGALAEASSGSGHSYRVKPGSWRLQG